MINDDSGILAGLYRESASCTTCSLSSSHIGKEITFFSDRRTNMYYIEIIFNIGSNGKFTWKMFLNKKELSEDEIIELYTVNNMKRLLKFKE